MMESELRSSRWGKEERTENVYNGSGTLVAVVETGPEPIRWRADEHLPWISWRSE